MDTVPRNSILNINYPASRAVGVKVCRTHIHYYTDHYVQAGPNTLRLEGEPIFDGDFEDSDVMLCHRGYITIAPMSLDRTGGSLAEEYRKIAGEFFD